MSKAILVMDMPSRCRDCPLRISIDESICVKTLKDITDKEYFEKKPDWCPLKEVPEKLEIIPIGDVDRGIVYGYNQCIDEILGGNE